MSFYDLVSNEFRRHRNHQLNLRLHNLYYLKKNKIRILDVGGTESFWRKNPFLPNTLVTIVNLEWAFKQPYWFGEPISNITREIGNTLDLEKWRDQSFDVVLCNSVIEHVGGWRNILKAANELRHVCQSGWVQTPAFSFPIDPHYALPFVHWVAEPIRGDLLRIFPHHGEKDLYDPNKRREAANENNLVTLKEFTFLFPETNIIFERFLGIKKSYIATWGEMSVS